LSWKGTLSLYEHRDGFRTQAPEAISYEVAAGEAHFGPVELAGHVLSWTLDPGTSAAPGALLSHEIVLAEDGGWIARCDRIDFPPGGVAYRHTHPGPGVRYLLEGALTIESEG
jgi:hypothetical protein